MHRSPEAEPSRNAPPRNGMRSRASSSKLLARGAMTIEEQQDEEDASGPEETRKESLIELLSSAPATQDSPTSRDLSSPGKRTVPAVVLGTPPPVFSEQAQKQTPPSINRPDRNVAMQDTLDVKEVKSKSSAEELADFFKSTAPPISTTPPVATKNKGFKSLMSKVTGKKKDDERAPTPTPTSASQTRLNLPLGEAIPPRRRKSLRNVESDQTSPPSSYRLEDTPPVPNRGILRKRSRDAGLPGTAVGGPQSYSAVTEAGDGIASGPESSTSSPIQPTSPAHSNSVGVSNQQSPRRVASSTEDPSPAAITLDPPTDSVSSVPALEDQHTRSMPVLLTPAAGAILQPERTPTFSDANSFQTAEEGEEPLDERKSVGGTDTATEMGQFASIPDRKRSAAWEATAPPAPSIPLTDLVPLRHLLQHATSAFECRLLLSAILTQWGVPQSPSGCNTTEPTPESRVTAWLLSGREGPIVGDTPSSSTFSKIDDEIVTPTQNYSALLPSAPTAPVRKSNEEEILSSETTSEASLSGEELREGLPPRTAKSAQRSSPIVLQPVAGGRDLPGAVDVSTNRGMISAGI